MPKLVKELQREALESSKETSELLRKASFVARKLKLEEFSEWIKKEQEGYAEDDDMPEYRNVPGKLMASDPFQGWIPINFPKPEIQELVSKKYLRESISHIEELISGGKEIAELLPHMKKTVFQPSDMHRDLIFSASKPFVKTIPKVVRDTILNWTLKLEEDGILGEDYDFSEEEKDIVSHKSYNIENFLSVQSMSKSQIQQGTKKSKQTQNIGLDGEEILKDFLEQLSNSKDKLDLGNEKIEALESELSDIKEMLQNDNKEVGSVINKLKSIKAILEGAAGNLLASGVASKIPEVIAAISAG